MSLKTLHITKAHECTFLEHYIPTIRNRVQSDAVVKLRAPMSILGFRHSGSNRSSAHIDSRVPTSLPALPRAAASGYRAIRRLELNRLSMFSLPRPDFPATSWRTSDKGGYPPWIHRPSWTPQVPASAFARSPAGKPRIKNRGRGSLLRVKRRRSFWSEDETSLFLKGRLPSARRTASRPYPGNFSP